MPVLYLKNEVIARRHVRWLILGGFFPSWLSRAASVGLFGAWGTAEGFLEGNGRVELKRHISKTRDEFVERAGDIVDASIRDRLGEWLLILPDEVEEVARGSGAKEDLLESFMLADLIPKYAFPVDVVKLANPEDEKQEDRYESQNSYSGISRDLRIALTEYAPGAEIILGRFPDTFIYRSAAVYDPSAHQTDYTPHEKLNECRRCRSVTLTRMEEESDSECPECGSNDVISMPNLRPRGLTVDAALPEGGGEGGIQVRLEGASRIHAAGTTTRRRQCRHSETEKPHICQEALLRRPCW